MTKLKYTKVAIKEWNLKVFENVFTKIKELKKLVEAHQNSIHCLLLQLFSNCNSSYPRDLCRLIGNTMNDRTNEILIAQPTAIKIYKTIFQMQGNKSPGPNGMSPIFYKKFWNIVGKDLILAIQQFIEDGKLSKATNHTFLAFIPKKQATDRVEMFRPISLCNVVYKVVTKVLASRVRNGLSSIIHPSHAAFIPNRSITNNCIINHEVMFFMKSKKGKNGFYGN